MVMPLQTKRNGKFIMQLIHLSTNKFVVLAPSFFFLFLMGLDFCERSFKTKLPDQPAKPLVAQTTLLRLEMTENVRIKPILIALKVFNFKPEGCANLYSRRGSAVALTNKPDIKFQQNNDSLAHRRTSEYFLRK